MQKLILHKLGIDLLINVQWLNRGPVCIGVNS